SERPRADVHAHHRARARPNFSIAAARKRQGKEPCGLSTSGKNQRDLGNERRRGPPYCTPFTWRGLAQLIHLAGAALDAQEARRPADRQLRAALQIEAKRRRYRADLEPRGEEKSEECPRQHP